MYLKKIIASGFKSFADRVSINLEKNHITGIVGPNGSGKSNTIDAVRWVMGEQNAKMLRGDKATDIIFNGSEKRKPHGMAEVTLVFDNSEASPFCPPEYRHEPEISLMRRIYADGEREYFINKKPCRLKDLLDFFAYTGLGGRSYSMIQQGQVDRILQAKPEELREIIEEAAGTLVFKKRKAEAQKKLENTKLNLSRIDDILKELDRQKKALKDQVEKATTYKNKSEELRTKDLAVLAHNFRFFSERIAQLRASLDAANDQEVDLQNSMVMSEGQLTELQSDLASADPEVHALAEEITIIRERLASSEAQLSSALQLLGGGDQRLVELKTEIQEEQIIYSDASQRVESAKESMDKALADERVFQEFIENFDELVSHAEEQFRTYQSKALDLDSELRNLDRASVTNSLRLETIERDVQQFENNLLGYNDKIATADSDLSQLKIVLDGASIKVANRKRTLDDIVAKKAEIGDLVQKRSAELSDLQKRKEEYRDKAVRLRSRVEVLDALNQEQNGNIENIRNLMDALKDDQGQTSGGFLSDHLAFNDKAHQISESVRKSLEKFFERAFVDDRNALEILSRACIESKSPSFTVALIDSDEGSATINVWGQRNGFDSATNYLTTDKDNLGLLLSRILIAKEIPLEIADIPRGTIIISESGSIWQASSDIVLGSACQQSGALSRKEEKINLEKELFQLEKVLMEVQQKITQLDENIQTDYAQIKDVDQKLHLASQDWMHAMGEFENTKRNAEAKRESSTLIREEYASINESIRKAKAERLRLYDESSSIETQKSNAQKEKENLSLEMANVEDERNEIKRQYSQKQMDLASSKARAQSMKENFEQYTTQLENIEVKISRRKEALMKLEKDMEEASTRISTLEKDIESFIFRREDLEEKLLEKREANSGLLEQIRVIENRVKDARLSLGKLQKEMAEKNLEFERTTIGLSGSTQQATERYQIDLSSYEDPLPEGFQLDRYTKDIQKIRTHIETMGPINMMAIDEYETISNRESFISRQKDEVEASANLLESAIDEIEENSEEKFLAAFHILNREFQGLFPILFPGGDGYLLLTNEARPLDGGIEIMVRLPGKKRQPMRLFSGGEKALTAIALIFALLKSKPTPFCFLDEVDAPLDETNVGRYNRVLEALSERFQFIVITHNRRTMEVLDTLYGVTMQEPGVSKVVGVDMSKDIPAHLQKAFKETQPEQAAGASSI